MGIIIYTSSASANQKIKKEQAAIMDYLTAKNIKYEEIDLCVHTDAKDIMRSKIPADIQKLNKENKKTVIPPQVFNDDEYCGDYSMFFEAREMELLHTFFKVAPDDNEQKKLDEYKCQNIPIKFY